jgi:hypothetical protein
MSKDTAVVIEGRKCDFCGSVLPPTKRRWKRYCNAKCKMSAWEREHPRQKLRIVPSIILDGWLYDLTNRRIP